MFLDVRAVAVVIVSLNKAHEETHIMHARPSQTAFPITRPRDMRASLVGVMGRRTVSAVLTLVL